MSVENLSKALNIQDHRLTPAMRLLLVGIANHDGDGGAFPKIATLAKYVGVSERQIQKQLSKLEQLKRIRREIQDGGRRELPDFLRPNRYFVDYETRIPKPGGLEDTGWPTGHPPGGLQDTPPGGLQDTPEPDLETYIEPSLILIDSGDILTKQEIDSAEEIYKAYPKHVAKPAALKAIRSALRNKKISAPDLLEKTKIYALSRKALDPKFTPHPATWFNQERWNDTTPTRPQNDSTSKPWLWTDDDVNDKAV